MELLLDWSCYTPVVRDQPMLNPSTPLCHNPNALAGEKVGGNDITIQIRKGHRYLCKACGRTLAAIDGTPLH